MASRLGLILLGGFEARLASGIPLLLPTNKAQALLAYLAMAPNRPHLRNKLATLLWPGAGDEQARQSLRQALMTLRRALGARPILFADHGEVTLEGASLDIDVVRFEALIAESSVAALEAAAALYQGDLLEGVRVKEPPFDEWLQRERQRLRELAQQGLLHTADPPAPLRPGRAGDPDRPASPGARPRTGGGAPGVDAALPAPGPPR